MSNFSGKEAAIVELDEARIILSRERKEVLGLSNVRVQGGETFNKKIFIQVHPIGATG